MCLDGYYHSPVIELLTMCTLVVGIYVGSATVKIKQHRGLWCQIITISVSLLSISKKKIKSTCWRHRFPIVIISRIGEYPLLDVWVRKIWNVVLMHMCTFVHTHIFMELVNSQPHNRKILFFATTWRILFSVKKFKHRNINIIYSHIPDLQTWIHNFIPLSASESLKTEMESLSGVTSISSHNIPKHDCNCAHCSTLLWF